MWITMKREIKDATIATSDKNEKITFDNAAVEKEHSEHWSPRYGDNYQIGRDCEAFVISYVAVIPPDALAGVHNVGAYSRKIPKWVTTFLPKWQWQIKVVKSLRLALHIPTKTTK